MIKALLFALILGLFIFYNDEIYALFFKTDSKHNESRRKKTIEFNDESLPILQKEETNIGTGSLTATAIEFNDETLPMLQKEFFAIDCETTGLSCYRDRIVEISAIHFINGKPTETFSSLIKSNVAIPESVTAINHITNEMIATAPDELQVINSFIKFLGKGSVGEVMLCAHNAEFDIDFLRESFMRLGLKATFLYIDTLAIARSKFVPCENNKLKTLAKYYDLADEQIHRAGEDALICGKLLMVFINEEIIKKKIKQEQDEKRNSIVINPVNDRIDLLDIGIPNITLTNRVELGNRLRKEGKLKEAISQFDEARKRGCCHYLLYEWYAMAFRKLKDYDNEIDILDEAITLCEKGICNGSLENFRTRRDKAIDLLLKQRIHKQKEQPHENY